VELTKHIRTQADYAEGDVEAAVVCEKLDHSLICKASTITSILSHVYVAGS